MNSDMVGIIAVKTAIARNTMTSLKDLKRHLRLEALGRRDALDPAWRIEASIDMAEHAPAIDLAHGAVVSGFLPIRSEADLRPLMAALADRGARLCLPVVLDRETIVFRELVRGAEMVSTGFGTSGPGPEAAVLDPDIMLVPLAAFDRRGHRLGYGAGHYDRAIARLHALGRKPHLVGVAFDCQQVERVPDEPHDVMLAEMLTESGLRSFAPAV
jgi:5-formyltetrahydrofolate cyclo-ligase